MDTFNRQNMHDLIEARVENGVSIYLPTHAVGEEGQQDLIVLRNLLDQAEQALRERGMGAGHAAKLLKPGVELLSKQEFWNSRAKGLALYFAPGRFDCWRLPVGFEAFCWVGERFYVKPLFPLLDEAGRYYLLAISQNRVRLFSGNRYELAEVPVEDLPHRLSEVIEHELPDGTRQSHTGQPSFPGKEGMIFFGQGDPETVQKKHDLIEFFRVLDRTIRPLLQGQAIPLLFAGVEYLFPLYRQVSTYPHLHPEPIQTNPDRLNPAELRKRAEPLLESYWSTKLHQDMQRFEDALGTSRVSANLPEILQAAEMGRVDSLFVAIDARIWGHWDKHTAEFVLSDSPTPDDEDLLNLAAIRVYGHAGRVHAVKAKDVPAGVVAAALFRYAESSPSASARQVDDISGKTKQIVGGEA